MITDPTRTIDIIKCAQNLPTGFGILYRHFGQSNRFDIAIKLSAIALEKRLFLSISHDPELEKVIKPDGVHWPKSTLKKFHVSQKTSRIHTTSAHTHKQLSISQKLDFDACFLSSVFPSHSPTAPKAMGIQRFRNLARGTDMPLYALGGVTHENAKQVAPYAGFAGVSELF